MLKNSFTLALILRHFNPAKEVFIKYNTYNFMSLGIFSQEDNQGVLYLVAFMSKKYNPTKYNYKIYNKELLAIIYCFKCQRPKL